MGHQITLTSSDNFQLGVYLRLNDLPVPGLYGPSADEPFKTN